MTWSATGTSNVSPAAVGALLIGNITGGQFYSTSQGTGNGSAGDNIFAALYGNNPTVSTSLGDTLAKNAYNGASGQWVTANEVTGTGYTAAGVTIGTTAVTITQSSNVIKFTSSVNPSWSSATFSNVYGALVYDSTVTNKYAYCWNYFGGAQSVTSGTFTVNWNAGGIFTITC